MITMLSKYFENSNSRSKNVGRDVVGKIPHNFDGLRLQFDPGPAQARLRSEQRIEVNRQNVRLDHLHIPRHPKLQPQLRRQHPVQLHRDQPPRAVCASTDVRIPRPGPISSTVLWATSPKASTMRAAASSLVRKCCPNLGLVRGRRADTTFGTLTLTFRGK